MRGWAPRDHIGTVIWFTPAKAGSRRWFKQGELMPDLESDYGPTIWQWDENRSS
jgi:hypothetical protein